MRSCNRFAALELAPPAFKARAISLVLAGGIVGAFTGPNPASATRDGLGAPFAGAYVALARALQRWDARRRARGEASWAMPLQLGSHTVFGTLLLSAQRGLRRRGQRYAEEQALIERWLDAVVRHTGAGWRLGHEIVLCGRLINGYGSTNQRGRDNLLHILEQLAERAPFASAAERAQAIAQARGAALADEGGLALDAALMRHGAAPRRVPSVPIRFVRRPKATQG